MMMMIKMIWPARCVEEALTTSITTHSGNAATGGIFDDDFDDEEGDDISHCEDFYLYQDDSIVIKIHWSLVFIQKK